jgi:SPP1 family predicted phage head-tail adaptor
VVTIGSRKHLVQIQRRTSGRDALGQPLTTWTDVGAQEYADIRFLRGLEAIRAGAQGSTAQVSIRINGFRTDLTTDMRVLHDGVAYSIQAVLPDMQRKRFVDLACEVIK